MKFSAARLRERVFRLRMAYQNMFGVGAKELNPAQKIVLVDLRKFCGIDHGSVAKSITGGAVDINATLVMEGRRQVYLRILKMSKIDDFEMVDISTGVDDNE